MTESFRWSFSAWQTYDECPAKYKFRYQLRLPSAPPGPAAARGLDLHRRVEQYILKQIDDVTPESGQMFGLKTPARVAPKYMEVLDQYRNHPNADVYVEKKFAFDTEWYLCGPKTEHAACVAVLDAARLGGPWQGTNKTEDRGLVRIAEWKSGSPKPTHVDQRKLYAVFGWKAWMAQAVEVTTYYLEDTAPPARLTLKTEEGYESLVRLWQARAGTLQADTINAPRPGICCRWCDYAKSKGGPCVYGG